MIMYLYVNYIKNHTPPSAINHLANKPHCIPYQQFQTLIKTPYTYTHNLS